MIKYNVLTAIIFCIVSQISFATNWGYNEGGMQTSGVGGFSWGVGNYYGPGNYGYGGNSQNIKKEDEQILNRFTEHIVNNTILSSADRLYLNENALIDKHIGYVFNKSLKGQNSFESVQEKIVTSLMSNKQKKNYFKFIKSRKGTETGLSDFKNKSALMSLTHSLLIKRNPKTHQDKVFKIVGEISQPGLSSLFEAAYANRDLKPIVLSDKKFDQYDKAMVRNMLTSFLQGKKNMSPAEAMKFQKEFVITPFDEQMINRLIDMKGNDKPVVIERVLNSNNKWRFLRNKLNANAKTRKEIDKANEVYEAIRSSSGGGCSFRPKKFGNAQLLSDIQSLSNKALSDQLSPKRKTSCENKLKQFKDVGQKIELLSNAINAKKNTFSPDGHRPLESGDDAPQIGMQSGGPPDGMQSGGPPDGMQSGGYTEAMSGNQNTGNNQQMDLNGLDGDLINGQNNLASHMASFLDLGCKFEEGNSSVLSLASRFTEILGESASTLNFSPEVALLANTLSAVSNLTSSLMKMFKGETPKEKGNRQLASLADRHEYLKQMCTFKKFVYSLDLALAHNPMLAKANGLIIDANNKEIIRLNTKVACLENFKQSNEDEIIIQLLNEINLDGTAACVKFLKPSFDPKYKIDKKVAPFYTIYNRSCLKDGDLPDFCEDFDFIKMSAPSIENLMSFCGDVKNQENMFSMFDDMRNHMIESIKGNDSPSIDHALSIASSEVSRLLDSNNEMRQAINKSLATEFTADMQLYVSATGNALFSNDEDESPMINFFNSSKKAMEEASSRFDGKIEKLLSKKIKFSELCDMAPTALSDLDTLNEERQNVDKFCQGFQIDTRTPFKSHQLRTHTFIRPSRKDGLNAQCSTFHKYSAKMTKGKNFDVLFNFMNKCPR